MRAAIVARPIDVSSILAEVGSPSYGATALFLGTVRNENDGRSVTGIEYAAYLGMAEAELRRIADEAVKRFGTESLVVEHRVGVLEVGDVSVAVAVAHTHRASALDATRYVIEQLKKRVPIWKRERYSDGTREWVDPTAGATVDVPLAVVAEFPR